MLGNDGARNLMALSVPFLFFKAGRARDKVLSVLFKAGSELLPVRSGATNSWHFRFSELIERQ
jgi:hypothetical protein